MKKASETRPENELKVTAVGVRLTHSLHRTMFKMVRREESFGDLCEIYCGSAVWKPLIKVFIRSDQT